MTWKTKFCGMLVIVCNPSFVFATQTATVRMALDALEQSAPHKMLNAAVLKEAVSFDLLQTNECYDCFASVITNGWQINLQHLESVATNDVERYLILGVGKHYDGFFFVDYCSALADLRRDGRLSDEELDWSLSSTKGYLDQYLVINYTAHNVTNLIAKLRTLRPNDDYWQDVISGVACSNLLLEVSAGIE